MGENNAARGKSKNGGKAVLNRLLKNKHQALSQGARSFAKRSLRGGR
jgi:hypothetical protein